MEFKQIAPGFHSQDGLCFQRLEDGRVHVRLVVPILDHSTETGYSLSQAVTFQTILPAASWASVVASVSAKGETGETFNEALRWHDNTAEADVE